MTGISVAICRISRNNFKHQYLRNKRFFLAFLLHIWNVHQIYNILKKKDEHPSPVISEIIDSERVGLLKRLKGLASEHHSVSNVLTGFQTLLKSARHHYYRIFSMNSEVN